VDLGRNSKGHMGIKLRGRGAGGQVNWHKYLGHLEEKFDRNEGGILLEIQKSFDA